MPRHGPGRYDADHLAALPRWLQWSLVLIGLTAVSLSAQWVITIPAVGGPNTVHIAQTDCRTNIINAVEGDLCISETISEAAVCLSPELGGNTTNCDAKAEWKLLYSRGTFANIPASPAAGDEYTITNATTPETCEEGGGTEVVKCFFDGANWVSFFQSQSTTLEQARATGNTFTGAISEATAVTWLGLTGETYRMWMASGGLVTKCTDSAGNPCHVDHQLSTGNYWRLRNAAGADIFKVTEAGAITGTPVIQMFDFGCDDTTAVDPLFLTQNFATVCQATASLSTKTRLLSTRSGTVQKLFCRLLTTPTAGNSIVLTVQVATVDTAVMCTIANPNVTCNSGALTAPVPLAGDGIAIKGDLNVEFNIDEIVCRVEVVSTY